MRVLIVEDEPRTADVVSRALTKGGVAVDIAGDGEHALELACIGNYDAIVLDAMLPGRSGFEVCRLLRERGIWTAVLMLTAREATEDRVAGLACGADAYLVKPFALSELHARLRSLWRRGPVPGPVVLTVGDLCLDPARRQVRRGSVEIALSAKEFAVLEALMRRRGEVVSRPELIEAAWSIAYEDRSNVIEVYVRRLRGKIDAPFGTRCIQTVRGVGYRVCDDSSRAAGDGVRNGPGCPSP